MNLVTTFYFSKSQGKSIKVNKKTVIMWKVEFYYANQKFEKIYFCDSKIEAKKSL